MVSKTELQRSRCGSAEAYTVRTFDAASCNSKLEIYVDLRRQAALRQFCGCVIVVVFVAFQRGTPAAWVAYFAPSGLGVIWYPHRCWWPLYCVFTGYYAWCFLEVSEGLENSTCLLESCPAGLSKTEEVELEESKMKGCTTMFHCMIASLNHGLRNGGGIGDVLRQPSYNVRKAR